MIATSGKRTAHPAHRLAASAAMAAVFLITVCAAVPVALYAGNQEEFTVPLIDILPVGLPYALAVMAGLALFGAALPASGFDRYLGLLAALAVLVWIQGHLLVWDYGPLDGRSIRWMDGAWRGVVDLALWVAVLVSAYLLPRFRRLLPPAAVATLVIQMVALALTVVPRADELLFRDFAAADSTGREAIVRFSTERNVLHIVMDGFQSDIFREILDAEHDLKDRLDGFTLFRDNLGVFPYTQMTVPALLSGKVYHNQVPADAFIRETLQGRTILSEAIRHGYEVDIAAPVGLRNVYGLAEHTHSYGITAGSHATRGQYTTVDAARLADLALFRVVPHFVKALVHRDELWVFQAMVPSKEYLQMQYFADLQFLEQLHDEMIADRSSPVYKLMHLMVSHRPTVGNASCRFDGVHPTSREGVTNQARCGLTRIVRILDRLKALGIYDSSLIVLMADHGAWVPAAGVPGREGSAPEAEVTANTIGMAIPVLAVKPPAISGPLTVSDAPTSIVDVPATIAGLLGMDARFDGFPVFDGHGEGERERRHLTYAYGRNRKNEDYYYAMREYAVRGSVFDPSAWQARRIFHPSGEYEILVE